MRLYYIAEAEGSRHSVCSAMGVDAERWNDIVREVRDWRLSLCDRFALGPTVELRPLELVTEARTASAPGASRGPVSQQAGVEILRSGLRLIERASLEGGVEVINVCLPRMRRGRSAEAGLGRLLTRINTSVASDGRHAFLILDERRRQPVTRLYRRLHARNLIPSRFEVWEDGAPTRDIPLRRIIGGPAFRAGKTDHLLQLAGFVACALLLQEDTGVGGRDRALGAFALLDHALNREASRCDPQGVVRR